MLMILRHLWRSSIPKKTVGKKNCNFRNLVSKNVSKNTINKQTYNLKSVNYLDFFVSKIEDIKIGYIFITGTQYSDVVLHFDEAILCQLRLQT